ncbi:hypothetical protein BFP72_18210 [Reichenbachiella sp. 5M10]|nr:hypothetical protein BFP72_18210 [Reichenbachiella sp. 5M10]
MDHQGFSFLKDSLYSGYTIEKDRNGNLKKKSPYLNGKMEGTMIGYYPSGDTLYTRPYHLGEKHGIHRGYYPNGTLQFRYIFENGFSQGHHQEWYADGSQKMDLHYLDGKERGLQRVWRPDGKMKSNYVVRENGRKYGFLGLKRCSKIDSETQNIEPYTGVLTTETRP